MVHLSGGARAGGAAALTGVVLVGLVVALILPGLVRRMLVSGIEARVAAPVSIEDVDLNLLTGRARVSGLRVGGPEGEPPLLQIPTVDTEIRFWPLLRGRTELAYLTLHRPALRVVRTGPATFNLVEAWRPSERAAPGAGATVQQLSIHAGAVAFVDLTESPPVERRLADIELVADRVSTAAGLRVSPTSFQAAFTVGDGTIEIEGTATPFARPRGAELRITAANLDRALFAPYLPERPRVDPGNLLAAEARYVLAADEGRTTDHFVSGRLVLGPLRVLPPGGDDPVLSLAGLAVEGVRVDLLQRGTSVREITLERPRIRIEREADGRFDLTAQFTGRAATDRAAAAPSPQGLPASLGGFTVDVDRLRVVDGAVRLVDRSTSPEAIVPVEQLRLELTGLRLGPAPRPASFAGSAALAGGRLELRGAVRPQPLEGIVAVRASEVPFEPFAPYARAALPGARAEGGSVDGVLTLALEDEIAPASLSGRLVARDVGLEAARSDGDRPPIATTERLVVDLGRITLGPTRRVAIERVHLDRPTIRLVREADGAINLTALGAGGGAARPSDGAPREPRADPSPRSDPSWSIARVDVSGGTVELRDESVRPTFTSALDRLEGALQDVGPGAERTRLALAGRLGGATLTLAGWLTPFAASPALHLEGGLDGYALPELDPYTEQYLGYRIRRGRLTADVELAREPSGFDSVAELTIRQIQLGEQVDDVFREKVGIPLTLALALLEGVDGTIRLRVPVSGALTDARVSVADTVWRALRNTIVKLLASPLRALGGVVTLGGRIGRIQIDPVGFAPGSRELDPAAERHLAGLAELLRSKPRLELEIRGSATADEIAAIKAIRLRERAREVGGGDYEGGLVRLYRGEKGFGSAASDEQMRQVLLGTIEVSPADLAELASARAAAVQQALTRHGVDVSRLYVASEGERAVVEAGPGAVRFEILS